MGNLENTEKYMYVPLEPCSRYTYVEEEVSAKASKPKTILNGSHLPCKKLAMPIDTYLP